MELLNCKPLSARISRKQCEINKAKGTFACDVCNGIDTQWCKIDGCLKDVVAKGMCKTHYNRSLLDRDRATKEAEERQQVVESTIPTDTPAVSQHERHVVNLMDMFKQKQESDLKVFAEKLSACKTAQEKLALALQFI